MHTNKKVLSRGIRYLAGALPLLFLGPVIINSSFKNQNNPLFYPVLGLGILVCITAMWFMFLGLRTITSSMFDKES
ncbi:MULTISPECIES: DUF6095 family protein [Flavobacterium]|uniref:DUF6095 family protein n=1 Tax=Flavobacterium TaxID=237 RepID=UPI00086DEBBC|nr:MULTISPECIES: DUF6095 family protein [Flavobacterium]MBN9283023.1 hypothetical protein [Flavobacterium sp.]ODS82221.1 MAG: hypothetical protein ABS44_18470 [Chryseobacterium sp. SCN 40-13]OJV67657.1 MAG: hypothetical protein BGO42_16630 [Flavobacterium sp. 40-81]